MTEQYQNIVVERRGRVGLVTLDRPEALNALNTALMNELVDAVTAMDTDPDVGAVVITGSAKAFAAGADIKEMSSNSLHGDVRGGLVPSLGGPHPAADPCCCCCVRLRTWWWL